MAATEEFYKKITNQDVNQRVNVFKKLELLVLPIGSLESLHSIFPFKDQSVLNDPDVFDLN
jgi:hypothetical protein